MTHYLIVWQDSDGNDATVFDSIVCASSESEAFGILADDIEATAKARGIELEPDGSELGYYYGCPSDCEGDCEGHGGICLRTVDTCATADDAEDACATYHTRWEVSHPTLAQSERGAL